MQNFNAPKKGNKGVVKAYLIAVALLIVVAMAAYIVDVHVLSN